MILLTRVLHGLGRKFRVKREILGFIFFIELEMGVTLLFGEWVDRFDAIFAIDPPNIDNDRKDKVVWVNGRTHDTMGVWEKKVYMVCAFCKSVPDSHNHLFLSVLILKGLERVRGVATLGYRGYLTMWRILHLGVLVGETSGPLKLEEMRRFVLGDDLERRMAASDTPFTTLYTILNEFCVPLIMDTVIRQIQALMIGRWKDAIRFELIFDDYQGQGSSASSVQTSQDGEADFYTRLLEMYRELGGNSHIRRAGGDVLHTRLNEPGSEDNKFELPRLELVKIRLEDTPSSITWEEKHQPDGPGSEDEGIDNLSHHVASGKKNSLDHCIGTSPIKENVVPSSIVGPRNYPLYKTWFIKAKVLSIKMIMLRSKEQLTVLGLLALLLHFLVLEHISHDMREVLERDRCRSTMVGVVHRDVKPGNSYFPMRGGPSLIEGGAREPP
nr:mediator of RNA polymerase II transcription subunit 14 [Tanacetum cinerariifolium]